MLECYITVSASDMNFHLRVAVAQRVWGTEVPQGARGEDPPREWA